MYTDFEVFTVYSFEDIAVVGCRAVLLGDQCLYLEGFGDLTVFLRSLDPGM